MVSVWLLVMASVFCYGLSQPAVAQNTDQKIAADVAFDKAKKAFQAGKYHEACKLLEDSLRLEATTGTRFRLAQCYEKIDRLASAWANYRAVAGADRIAKNTERAAKANEAAAALEPRLSKLTVVVPPEVGALSGFKLERDGKVVDQAMWSTAVPVDGGTHKLRATATGKAPWSKEVTVKNEEDSFTVEVPPLTEASQPVPPAVAPITSGRLPRLTPQASFIAISNRPTCF